MAYLALPGLLFLRWDCSHDLSFGWSRLSSVLRSLQHACMPCSKAPQSLLLSERGVAEIFPRKATVSVETDQFLSGSCQTLPLQHALLYVMGLRGQAMSQALCKPSISTRLFFASRIVAPPQLGQRQLGYSYAFRAFVLREIQLCVRTPALPRHPLPFCFVFGAHVTVTRPWFHNLPNPHPCRNSLPASQPCLSRGSTTLVGHVLANGMD